MIGRLQRWDSSHYEFEKPCFFYPSSYISSHGLLFVFLKIVKHDRIFSETAIFKILFTSVLSHHISLVSFVSHFFVTVSLVSFVSSLSRRRPLSQVAGPNSEQDLEGFEEGGSLDGSFTAHEDDEQRELLASAVKHAPRGVHDDGECFEGEGLGDGDVPSKLPTGMGPLRNRPRMRLKSPSPFR